jgi:hypothetical protein
VFIGFSHTHKGFKCLDVASGRVYVSRDVIFDENIFPFSKLHSNAGARLRAEINLLDPTLLNPNYSSHGDKLVVDQSDDNLIVLMVHLSLFMKIRNKIWSQEHQIMGRKETTHYTRMIRDPFCRTAVRSPHPEAQRDSPSASPSVPRVQKRATVLDLLRLQRVIVWMDHLRLASLKILHSQGGTTTRDNLG